MSRDKSRDQEAERLQRKLDEASAASPYSTPDVLKYQMRLAEIARQEDMQRWAIRNERGLYWAGEGAWALRIPREG